VRKDPFIGRLGEWRHQEAGGRWWSLTLPVSKSKKGEGNRWGTELVRGKRRQPGGTSLRLLTRTGGRPTAANGASVLAGAAVAQLCMEENDPDALGLRGTNWVRSWAAYEKSQENGKQDADAVWAEK
jgi:hypothetical protein